MKKMQRSGCKKGVMMKTKSKRRKYVGMYSDEGSFVNFYRLKNRKTMAFKEFGSKKKAQESRSNQDLLSYHNFAPKVFSKVMKIDVWDEDDRKYRRSGWGYITEIAETFSYEDDIDDNERDDLLTHMEDWCGFVFYDCHPGNYGYVKRKGKYVLVCIDTGSESFTGEYCY